MDFWIIYLLGSALGFGFGLSHAFKYEDETEYDTFSNIGVAIIGALFSWIAVGYFFNRGR